MPVESLLAGVTGEPETVTVTATEESSFEAAGTTTGTRKGGMAATFLRAVVGAGCSRGDLWGEGKGNGSVSSAREGSELAAPEDLCLCSARERWAEGGVERRGGECNGVTELPLGALSC